MNDTIYFLPAEELVQRFYKPDNKSDFILFDDFGVPCPSKNPFATDTGKVSVNAVCKDCKSFINWVNGTQGINCAGNLNLKDSITNIKHYLDPIEVTV